MLKVGTFVLLSNTTCKPFFNVASSARGSFTFKTSWFTGALPLMTAPFVVCCCCGAPPCANASDETSATNISAATIVLFFMILIADNSLLAGSRFGFHGRGDHHRAVGVEQILVGYALHVFFRHSSNLVEPRIDQVWIVVVDRVLTNRDRANE